MELMLENTIFLERNFGEKFEEFIKINKDIFVAGNWYDICLVYSYFQINYEESIFKDIDFNKFIPRYKKERIVVKIEKVLFDEAMKIQKTKILDTLKRFNIEYSHIAIIGNTNENPTPNIVIKVNDNGNLPKNKKDISRSLSIMPDNKYIIDAFSQSISQKLTDIFHHLFKAIRNVGDFSEILGMERTDDINQVWSIFVDKYSRLGNLCYDDNYRKEILYELRDKITQYYDKEKISPVNNNEVIEDKKININTAKYSDFKHVPGFSILLYEKIVYYREQKLFQSVDEVLNVTGIGKKKFEKVKHLFEV